MGDFSDAAIEIAEAFDTDLLEEVESFTYTVVETGMEYDYRGIAEAVKLFETDNESVTMTTGKWFCLKHELPVTPRIDDTLTISGQIYYIARVTPTDKVIGWYLYGNA